jgi:hypothetical protein
MPSPASQLRASSEPQAHPTLKPYGRGFVAGQWLGLLLGSRQQTEMQTRRRVGVRVLPRSPDPSRSGASWRGIAELRICRCRRWPWIGSSRRGSTSCRRTSNRSTTRKRGTDHTQARTPSFAVELLVAGSDPVRFQVDARSPNIALRQGCPQHRVPPAPNDSRITRIFCKKPRCVHVLIRTNWWLWPPFVDVLTVTDWPPFIMVSWGALRAIVCVGSGPEVV